LGGWGAGGGGGGGYSPIFQETIAATRVHRYATWHAARCGPSVWFPTHKIKEEKRGAARVRNTERLQSRQKNLFKQGPPKTTSNTGVCACVCVCVCVFPLRFGRPLQHPESASTLRLPRRRSERGPAAHTHAHAHSPCRIRELPSATHTHTHTHTHAHTHTHTHTHARTHTHTHTHQTTAFILLFSFIYQPEWILIVLNRAFTTQMLFRGPRSTPTHVFPHDTHTHTHTQAVRNTHTYTQKCTNDRRYIKAGILDIPVKPSGVIPPPPPPNPCDLSPVLTVRGV